MSSIFLAIQKRSNRQFLIIESCLPLEKAKIMIQNHREIRVLQQSQFFLDLHQATFGLLLHLWFQTIWKTKIGGSLHLLMNMEMLSKALRKFSIDFPCRYQCRYCWQTDIIRRVNEEFYWAFFICRLGLFFEIMSPWNLNTLCKL